MTKNNAMCKCGHEYGYHVNPRTSVEDGCIFSYNCDCEKFTLQEKEPTMKVLTKNIKLYFECDEDCPRRGKVIESDPAELARSGPPVCSVCNNETAINDECIIAN